MHHAGGGCTPTSAADSTVSSLLTVTDLSRVNLRAVAKAALALSAFS